MWPGFGDIGCIRALWYKPTNARARPIRSADCAGRPLSFLQLVVLTIVQGITEFLPISSSGHLVIVPWIADWPDQGLELDVAVHVGTLAAVMIYFWRDLWRMGAGLAGGKRPERKAGRALVWRILVSVPPVIIVGGLVAWADPAFFRSVEVIAWATAGFGVVLWIADRVGMTVRRIEHMTYSSALIIGLAQALAIIPGTSRSGITMTAARMMGFERVDAARFSMLMSIPVIIAAGAVAGYRLAVAETGISFGEAALAAGLSCITALLAIAGLMALIRRIGFGPFALYRLALGALLLVWLYAFN